MRHMIQSCIALPVCFFCLLAHVLLATYMLCLGVAGAPLLVAYGGVDWWMKEGASRHRLVIIRSYLQASLLE